MNKLLLSLLALIGTGLSAQHTFEFTDIAASTAAPLTKTVRLDLAAFHAELKGAPAEFSRAKSKARVRLPLPDGTSAEYRVWDVDQLPNHPEIGSYRVESAFGSGRIAVSPYGMSAVIQGPEGYFVIDAVDVEGGLYQVADFASYMSQTMEETGPLGCGYEATGVADLVGIAKEDLSPNLVGAGAGFERKLVGNEARELRQYDLIMTCTGEFASRNGGTVESVLSAFNTAVTTINAILEPQVGVRMNLIEAPGLVYLDGATDAFSNPTDGAGLLPQVLGAFEANSVGPESYDLGHLFTSGCSDGIGGIVSGAACTPGKTRGVTCVSGGVVGAALRIMAHEIAHQFAVSHTWNSCPGSENQRASETAFEPGGGTTLMSYSGACSDQNIGAGDAYYHVASLEQFIQYTRETGARDCATVIETDNRTPEVTLEYVDGFTIPISTPFKLEGSATDANGDELLYNWEQFDLGPVANIQQPQGNAPLFRSVEPTPGGNVRYFPRLDRTVNGISFPTEVLPTYTRDLTFRLTAHDYNDEAGGVDWQTVSFHADAAAGPFLVSTPEADWKVGDYQEVNWQVAGTDQAPVNCRRVNILLSNDAGASFNFPLAENVPNTGSAFVTVPPEALGVDTRILIEAADNVFFNVNADEFTVKEATQAGYTLEPDLRFQELCLPSSFTTAITTSSILGFSDTITLSVPTDGLPEGARVSLSQDRLFPGQSADLFLELDDVSFTGIIDLTVLGVTNTLDTARRKITLDAVDTDFTDMQLTTPEEGTGGIVLTTIFDWTDAANADVYDIEIATAPSFAEAAVFESVTRLGESTYQPFEFFTANTLYYWRVRPVNRCGAGTWLPTQSFRTVNSVCQTYEYDGDPINIPGRGPAVTKESVIFVEEQGAINDLNLPNVRIQYQFVSALQVALVSPAGTEVFLYDRDCRLSNTNFLIGFDDEAPAPASCPVDDRRVVLPRDALAKFNGEDTFGEWKLKVTAVQTEGTVGAIEDWSIEFCSDAQPEVPVQLANNATEVPPLATNIIIKDNLEVASASFGSDDIVYSLTGLPTVGDLTFNGVPLLLGATFRQSDINNFRIRYTHTVDGVDEDSFRFLVTTPDGGYQPIERHDLIITKDATVVSTREERSLAADLRVFPNPASGVVNVQWASSNTGRFPIELFDLTGHRLRVVSAEASLGSARVELTGLPSGLYLLRVGGHTRRIVKQ